MPLPSSFLAHLRTNGYHPRSPKAGHSDALGQAIVDDLVATCPLIASRAAAGDIVYDLNFTLTYATAEWNVDVVLGTPPPGTLPPGPGTTVVRLPPTFVQIAIELKAVMTEHRKAVKNRKRDLEAHHEHVHNYSASTIAGGVLLTNIAPRFRSPLRPAGQITTHSHPTNLVQHCINQAAAISVAGGPTGHGLDSKAVIVVNMDNINLSATAYHIAAPAPAPGNPMHYDSFIQRICQVYRQRFP